jgi:hypothetical protein
MTIQDGRLAGTKPKKAGRLLALPLDLTREKVFAPLQVHNMEPISKRRSQALKKDRDINFRQERA